MYLTRANERYWKSASPLRFHDSVDSTASIDLGLAFQQVSSYLIRCSKISSIFGTIGMVVTVTDENLPKEYLILISTIKMGIASSCHDVDCVSPSPFCIATASQHVTVSFYFATILNKLFTESKYLQISAIFKKLFVKCCLSICFLGNHSAPSCVRYCCQSK